MKFCTKSFCSLQQLMYLHMVLISFICFHSLRVSSTGNETDRLALLHFKASVTSSDPIGILNSWNSSVPHCSWLGVTCNRRHGRVASLILEGQKLLGPISPYIGNLSFIRRINLQNNSLHGAIPQQFGKLFRLQHLILNNNTIGGEIPVNLTSCYNLQTILLGRNNLSGEIPHQIGSLAKLQTLGLYVNKLTGLIPSSLANLTSLEQFSVGRNNLVGEIPREMSELKNMYKFSVPANNLSGAIPPFLFNCSSIKFLSFTANKFHGVVPDKGFNLPNLEEAYLGENQLSGRLDILQRLNIVIDVASALHYLHDLWEVPIIHRDLKPSNVLLDDDMVAHVGDFGLAKFLSASQSSEQGQTSTLGVLGTTGYAAPEYGLGAAASKEGDIYSFGILLLEMFSGRRPTDDIFTDGLNLVDFVKNALPERVVQVADPVLLATRNVDETDTGLTSITPAREEEYQEIEQAGYRTTISKKIEQHELSCLLSVMEIGVSCSEESPSRRANLKNVLGKLQRVKDTFLSVQLTEGRHRVSYIRRLPR